MSSEPLTSESLQALIAGSENAPELLPCPFCGGEVKLIEGDESAYVQCLNVKMHRAIWFSGDNNAADEVREQWNKRNPAPIALATELLAAREALETARQEGIEEGRRTGRKAERLLFVDIISQVVGARATEAIIDELRQVAALSPKEPSHE